MAEVRYNWKRFWCPREGKINLSDGGFLYDPESEFAQYVESDVVPFEQIADRPCLALLGEPGIGKSMAMEGIRASLYQALRIPDEHILYVNLNEYGDESRLIRDVFECDEFVAWRKGNRVLHLLLDSLDECRILIPQVATILISRLGGMRDQIGRLRLRIACRTADWPTKLEMSLPDVWGKDGFAAYELAPLRRRDVEIALTAEGIAADTFLAEVQETESVPLAFKPVTLKLLISVFRERGGLPRTRTGFMRKDVAAFVRS